VIEFKTEFKSTKLKKEKENRKEKKGRKTYLELHGRAAHGAAQHHSPPPTQQPTLEQPNILIRMRGHRLPPPCAHGRHETPWSTSPATYLSPISTIRMQIPFQNPSA
jgi:hypothetical protein